MEPEPNLIRLLEAFADETALRIAAHIAGHDRTAGEVAGALDLQPQLVWRHLERLVEAGLAEVRQDGTQRLYRFRRRPLLDALRQLRQRAPREETDSGLPDYDRKVLATFVAGGKLTSIPAQHKKREVILRWLAAKFEPGRMYDEREVNELLRVYHPDVASLRRYLVDNGHVKRQIIREVELDALVEGSSDAKYRNMYWRE